MKTIKFQKIAEIPTTSDGYSLVKKSLANDGSLLFLFVEPAGKDAVRERYTDPGGSSFPQSTMNTARRFRLVQTGGEHERVVELPKLDLTFPHVDVFPSGKVVVVGARCEWRNEHDYDLNGGIFDPITGRLSRILLGDGIEDLYVDSLDRIWVSYFDEGVFGNFGWGGPGPRCVGAAGLVCFSETGEKIWEYSADPPIADCYALNVTGSEAAIYFYTEFPVCKISTDFRLKCWNTGLSGCHHFAISDRAILMSKQYTDAPSTGYLGILGENSVTDIRKVKFVLPSGAEIPEGQLLGRGRHMYFFDDVSVHRATLPAVLDSTFS